MSLVCDCFIAVTDIRREALLAIQDITSLLGTESVTKIINKVSPLLVDAEVDVRLCICDLLESLAKIDFSLDDVVSGISLLETVFNFSCFSSYNLFPTYRQSASEI